VQKLILEKYRFLPWRYFSIPPNCILENSLSGSDDWRAEANDTARVGQIPDTFSESLESLKKNYAIERKLNA
jgi:hypothetical protein